MRKLIITLALAMCVASCATTSGQGSASSKGQRITRENLSQIAKTNYDLGTNYVSSANYGPAEEKLMKVVELEPNFPDVYNALGVLQERKGKLSDASALFAKAISLDPYYEIAVTNYTRLVCKTEGATNLANIASSADGTVQAGMFSGAAECANYHKQYPQALQFADQGIRVDPTYPTLYYHKAVAQSFLGNNSDVIRTLNQFHDIKGYTHESVVLGEKAARLSNNIDEANKYKQVLERQFRNTR